MKLFFVLFIFALFAIIAAQPTFADDGIPIPTPQTLEIKPGLPGVKTIPLVTTTPNFSSYPLGDIKVSIEAQSGVFESPGYRAVYLKWTPVTGTTKYNLLVRIANEPYTKINASYPDTYKDALKTAGSILIKHSEDYYVRIDACSGLNKCVSSKELFVPKLKKGFFPSPPISPFVPKKIIIEKVTPVKDIKDLDREEPGGKFASREGKLTESQKKQTILVQTVNNLFSWISTNWLTQFPFSK